MNQNKSPNSLGVLFAAYFLLSSLLALEPRYTQAQASAAQGATSQTSGTGTITGRVKNAATGTYLAGASVQLDGTPLSTLSESSGSYSVVVLPGRYTLAVAYTGLDTARFPVEVAPGQTVTQDVSLTSGVYAMEKFVVTGLREETALALQQQRHSPNAKTVVTTNFYGTPTDSPGELLQRIPGISTTMINGEVATVLIRGMDPGFSNLMVDGNPVAKSFGAFVGTGRGYAISELATTNLSQVELIKAPTPDQDADAIAGSINLVSKRSFDRDGRALTVNAATTLTRKDYDTSPFKQGPGKPNLSVGYADVFSILGGLKNLGIAADVSWGTIVRTSEYIGPNTAGALSQAYVNFDTNNPLTRAFGVYDYGGPTKKFTVGLNLDYKLSSKAFLYARSAYTTTERNLQAYHNIIGGSPVSPVVFAPGSTFDLSTVLPGPYPGFPTTTVSTATMRVGNSRREGQYLQFSIGGESKLLNDTANLAIQANYSYGLSKNPYFVNVNATLRGFGFQIDRRGRDLFYPGLTQTAGPDYRDPANYTINTFTNTITKGVPNHLSGLRADLIKTFSTAVPTYIKIGAKYKDDRKSDIRDNQNWTWVGADGIPGTADDAIAPYVDRTFRIGKGGYGPLPFLPLVTSKEEVTGTRTGYWAQTAADAYNEVAAFNARRTKINEAATSAYISGHINLGKLRILSGLRAERTELTTTSWVRNTTASWGGNSVGGASLDPAVVAANVARANRSYTGQVEGKTDYVNVFPGVHFIYEPTAALLFRASYNKAISRPGTGNLLPGGTVNEENMTVVVGNPELKPYTSDNFEVSAERYFEPIGLLSAGVFLKEISNYFRSFDDFVGAEGIDGNGLYAGFLRSTARNIGSARVRGFELSYQQQFRFLPGLLRNLGAFANLSYTSSVGTFGAAVPSNKIIGLTPRVFNAGISYVGNGWDVRPMINWQDKTYRGTSGTVDYDTAARAMIDLKVQYRISPRYSINLNVSNLGNEAEIKYISSDGRLPLLQSKPGTAFNLGATGRF
ncbi:MAG: TonB-dependent receptor [Verrucomicrobia bacterium]|nr:TonB-dependent receptor [Verrucomicrobiota bacterium]